MLGENTPVSGVGENRERKGEREREKEKKEKEEKIERRRDSERRSVAQLARDHNIFRAPGNRT